MRLNIILLSVLLGLPALSAVAGKKDKVVKSDESGTVIQNSPGSKVTNEVTVNGNVVYRKTCVDGKCTETTTKK